MKIIDGAQLKWIKIYVIFSASNQNEAIKIIEMFLSHKSILLCGTTMNLMNSQLSSICSYYTLTYMFVVSHVATAMFCCISWNTAMTLIWIIYRCHSILDSILCLLVNWNNTKSMTWGEAWKWWKSSKPILNIVMLA